MTQLAGQLLKYKIPLIGKMKQNINLLNQVSMPQLIQVPQYLKINNPIPKVALTKATFQKQQKKTGESNLLCFNN